MATLDYTVQILNLPAATTLSELYVFFSYCGTVEKIQLYRNDGQSSMALLTFRQPYAFRTALLLDDCVLADQRIRVVISKDVPISPVSNEWRNESKGSERNGFVPSVQGAIREKYCELSEKGREVMDQTRSVVSEAEDAASRLSLVIVKNEHVSACTRLLSRLLDKVSKFGSKLLGTRKRDNPDSRKQK